jgi:hypothetical protein
MMMLVKTFLGFFSQKLSFLAFSRNSSFFSLTLFHTSEMGNKSLLADTIIDCDDENCTAGGTVSGSVSSCL